ncbi:MAG: sugar ABC transporter permease [Spirochaetales bacterium]|nr:sugar ABC transporter permease [Spirochaetales bacterium]
MRIKTSRKLSGTVSLETPLKIRKRGLIYHIRKEPILYIMVLPAIAHFIIFRYIPMYGITIAFQKFDIAKGYFGSPWVGLHYIKQFLKDPFLFRIIRNTFVLNFLSLFTKFPAPIIFALMLNELRKIVFKRSIQTMSYLPHFISSVILVGLIHIFFASDGLINDILVHLGLPAERFLIDPKWFRFLYIGSGIWKSMGWKAILYLAALLGINQELYEAAYIDGANRWQRMLNITLPGISPTIIILLILEIGQLMNVGFTKAFLLQCPTTFEVSDVISTYVYRRGIEQMQISYAAAVGIFNSIVNFGLIIMANRLAKRYSDTSLW